MAVDKERSTSRESLLFGFKLATGELDDLLDVIGFPGTDDLIEERYGFVTYKDPKNPNAEPVRALLGRFTDAAGNKTYSLVAMDEDRTIFGGISPLHFETEGTTPISREIADNYRQAVVDAMPGISAGEMAGAGR